MMFGVVNDNCEAIIKVTLGRADAPKITVEALIDTGFTSFLSLPMSGKVQASPLSPPLRTVHETFALTRLKPYFKLENLDFECTCL
jgi:predicted aspartyl protease